MTFSLIARDPGTGQFGMVISSSSPAVAARCVHLRARVGAVASQNVTDPGLGPLVLDRLAAGVGAAQAVTDVVTGRAHISYRQLMAIGRTGGPAIWSGDQVLGLWGEAVGEDCAAAGNLLARADIPDQMVAAFVAARGSFGDRLMAALKAGLAAGGEAGPVRSAGLKIVGAPDWAIADLRIDWHDDPIAALDLAWEVYQPQMEAYIQRALDPTVAPSYGVPGDE
ncbi:DUF1028 domain-containing protein [Frigidibacter sp. RF13]|uniref:DUF1028 domain-containing protein n=1 Tax=Frigidibacter sp. RF13 TaxID=2997340 RepID=UPI00226EC275|nr:DUF1028 domain-containing protein [Frigidibacter sp. RF13]MCY1126254.1 DUF1028 domain-containing protein [Frigidibacter sp. RF13]